MKFKLFFLGIVSGVFLSSVVNAGALIPACDNILVPPEYGKCLAATEDCMKCAEKAPRQVRACLCFGQQPASYECYKDGFMPINMNIYYDDPITKKHISGNQDGACMKEDNFGCAVWQYARGYCKDWVHIDVVDGQASVPANLYCKVLQGRVDGENCVDLPTADGKKECSLVDLAQGNCKFGW